MNIRFILILLICPFCKISYANDSPFSTHIYLNLDIFNEDSLHIDIRLFDSFLGSGYQLFQSFTVTNNVTSINFNLPEISMGMISVRNSDKAICNSGAVIFNGDTLFAQPESYKTVLRVNGGENEFMQENFTLPFNLPSRITNNSSFKPKMVQLTYDLQIPEDPMLQAIYREYLRNVLATVKRNPGSFYLLRLLNENSGNITLKTLDTAITIFNEKVINTVSGRRLKSYIANGKWLLNKPNLNEVNIENILSKPESLASIIDSTKFTFIDFWASWCGPCREFNAHLVKNYASLDTSKIQIVSISLDDDLQKWKIALTKDKLPWLNFIDPSKKGFESDLAKLFNIQFIPQSFLFDKNGNIVALNLPINEILRIGK